MRAYVSVSLEQIAQWRDEQGNSGLWYVMQVINQLLDPRYSEFTAAFVGRLVSALISQAGTELGDQLDQILRAILSKMQQAETPTVMQVQTKAGRLQSECEFSPPSNYLPWIFFLSAVSDHGLRSPGSLSAGTSTRVFMQSAWADRKTCSGVCHDGVDEQATSFLWTV